MRDYKEIGEHSEIYTFPMANYLLTPFVRRQVFCMMVYATMYIEFNLHIA